MLRQQQIGAYCGGKPSLYLRFCSRPFLFELTKINGRFFRKTRGHAALRLTASFSLRGKSQQFSTRAFTFPQKPKGWQIEFRCAKAWFCLRHYYSKRRQLFKASPWGRMCALCRQPRCGFCAHMSLAILHLQRKNPLAKDSSAAGGDEGYRCGVLGYKTCTSLLANSC